MSESTEAVLARLDERTQHLTDAADTLASRAAVDSGRLARVETALDGLPPLMAGLRGAVDDLRRELRGGLDRAIGTADAAERRAIANAERLDGQAQRLDALALRVGSVEGEQRDAQTSRKTLLAVGSAIVLAGGVANAVGALGWMRDRLRSLVPTYDATADEDGAGDNDDDRLDL